MVIAVIFEVEIKDRKIDAYLEVASRLKQELTKIDGFISVERFQSLSDTNKYLSLSWWRDSESIEQWKSNKHHLSAQTIGKDQFFANYKISVCALANSSTMNKKS